MSTLNDTHPSEASRQTKWRIGQRMWRWFSTRTALLLLLLPTIIALTASYLLPQAPAYLYADGFRYQEWLSARQVEFRNWTPLLTTIGAFRIQETLWFRTLLALLVFVLLVSLGEQIRLLLGSKSVQSSPQFYSSPDTVSLTSSLPVLQTTSQVRKTLGPQSTHVKEGEVSFFYADRRDWARASATVLYLGLLLLAVGLAIQTRFGWRQSGIRVLPYQDVGIGPRGALQVRLSDVQPATQDGTEPSVPTANLQIAGQASLPIQLGVPTRRRGYRYLWVSRGGPSVQLSAFRVSDPESALVLYDYAVRPVEADSLQFSFSPDQDPDRQFILSEDKIVGWLRWEGAGKDSPEFRLWILTEDGQELGIETFAAGQDTSVQHAVIGGVDYRLEIARYIVLDIAYQPAQWVLWAGGALLGLGILGLLIPRTSIWVQVGVENDLTVVKVREQSQGLVALWDDKQRGLVVQLQDTLGPTSFEQAASRQQPHALPPEQDHLTHRNDQ